MLRGTRGRARDRSVAYMGGGSHLGVEGGEEPPDHGEEGGGVGEGLQREGGHLEEEEGEGDEGSLGTRGSGGRGGVEPPGRGLGGLGGRRGGRGAP